MNQIRKSLAVTIVRPTFGAVLLHLLFVILLVLLVPTQARAETLNCQSNSYSGDPLRSYMCGVVRNNPGAKLDLMLLEVVGNRGGAREVMTNVNTDPDTFNTTASMAKIVTAFMAMEMLASQHGANTPPTQNYARTGWTLETKVRIVEDRSRYVRVGSMGGGSGATGDIIYVSKGFATSPCEKEDREGRRGVRDSWGTGTDPYNAKFGLWTQTNGMEFTIGDLIALAMVKSLNDATMLLGAIVAESLGINALSVTDNVNISAHHGWLRAYADKMNQTVAVLLTGRPNTAAVDTKLCTPPGWSSTGNPGNCVTTNIDGTPRVNISTSSEWVRIAHAIYQRTENENIPNTETAYARYFTLTQAPPVPVRGFNSAGQCRSGTVRGGNTAGRLLASMPSEAVRLVKTGSINGPENLVAVAQCNNSVMVATIMRPPGGRIADRRDQVLGNLFALGGGLVQGTPCTVEYTPSAGDVVDRYSEGGTAEERDFAQTNFAGNVESPPEKWGVALWPEPSDGPGRDAPGDAPGAPSTSVTSDVSEEECAPEIDYAEQWGEDIKAKYNFGVLDRVFESQVDKIFGQQCIGRLIATMTKILDTVDTIRDIISSADMMAAVVSFAVTSIVRAILDQFFNALTNMICNVTNSIVSAIDNISKNLLCMKPLFGGLGKLTRPFEIPINIEDISCSGIAVNPLFFSGDPNQPLARGSVAGVNLGSIRSGDRPYFCPLGSRPKAAAAGSSQSWQCEPDPNYRPRLRDSGQTQACEYSDNGVTRVGTLANGVCRAFGGAGPIRGGAQAPVRPSTPAPCPVGQVLGVTGECVNLTGRN